MITCIIFIIVGSLLLTVALKELQRKLEFVKSGERAVGTVVQLVKEKDEDGTYYYPVFDIPTRRHEIITYRHTTGSSSPAWEIGGTAVFIFEPGKPDTVSFLRHDIFWWPLSLIALAVDLLVIGSGYFLLHGYFGS